MSDPTPIEPGVLWERALALSEALSALLGHTRAQLAVAESCTGGLIGHLVTSVAGSSAYFRGGVIAYSNDVKMGLLGVKEATLLQHGAVSRETVVEMVHGAIDVFAAEWGVATSGIAGPGGGSPDKPVGTVDIAVCHATGPSVHRRFLFAGDREAIKLGAACEALQLLHDQLRASPRY